MHSVLERLDENLWTVQAPLAPFGIAVGTRATLLRRGDGGMLVIADSLQRRAAEPGRLPGPSPWAGAPFVNDIAFLHRASGTLIVTDLAIRIRGPVNLRTRAYLAYGRCHGRLRSPITMRALVRDRRAARASADHILGWDFGEVREAGGPAALREALDWL